MANEKKSGINPETEELVKETVGEHLVKTFDNVMSNLNQLLTATPPIPNGVLVDIFLRFQGFEKEIEIAKIVDKLIKEKIEELNKENDKYSHTLYYNPLLLNTLILHMERKDDKQDIKELRIHSDGKTLYMFTKGEVTDEDRERVQKLFNELYSAIVEAFNKEEEEENENGTEN